MSAMYKSSTHRMKSQYSYHNSTDSKKLSRDSIRTTEHPCYSLCGDGRIVQFEPFLKMLSIVLPPPATNTN